MRLQAKIHLSTIPLLLLFLVGLGAWNFRQARAMVETQVFTHLQSTLDTFLKDNLDHRYQLLVSNRLDGIPSFVERYQQEVLQAAQELPKAPDAHIFVFGGNQLLFDSADGAPSTLTRTWSQELAGRQESERGFHGRLIHPSGHEELYYGIAFPPWNWLILFAVSGDEIHATLDQIRLTTLATALVGGLSLFLALTLLTRYLLLRPIQILTRSAMDIAKHPGLDSIPVHTEDEIGELARTMENTAGRLHANEKSLQTALEALRESENTYRTLVEQLPQNIFLKDRQGTYLSCNRSYAQNLGRTPEQIRGLRDVDLYPTAVAESFREEDERVLAQGGSLDVEVPVRVRGEERWVQKIKVPVHDATGEVFGLLGVHWDITERKRNEAELRQHREHLEDQVATRTRELESKNLELQSTLVELQRSNQELAQFAYVASHDLKEPLRMVSSYMQLLERRYRDQLDQDARDFIDYAVEGANRMQSLINDLLAFSRAGRDTPERAWASLDELLDQALDNLQTGLRESGAEIRRTPLPSLPVVRSAITQLFQNLISNAVKFRGSQPPRITIDAEPLGEDWRFSVADNGIGIDPNHFGRLFILFRRLHGREQYPGTGIGLALCKKIVERHGGRIWVESRKGEGSTFHFTLPSTPLPPMPGRFGEEPAEPAEPLSPRPH
jgi:PAS domain S-box-containing protein